MIMVDAIKEMAVVQQTTELNSAREYAQHLFLARFYQQRGTHQVMFNGGTAVRIVYNSPRFAETLAALLDRGKPRDTYTCVRCTCFFDCYFMLRKNMITPKQHQVLFKVKHVLAETRINFKAELGDFLPRSDQSIIGDFRKTLMAELERYG